MSCFINPNIVKDNNIWMWYDAANANSCTGSGATNWTSLKGNVSGGDYNTAGFYNGAAYSSTYGPSIAVDGTNDYIYAGYFNYTASTVTICAWVRPTDTVSRVFVDKGSAFRLAQINGAGAYMFIAGGGTGPIGSNTLQTNTWNYICGTANASGGALQVYQNGVLAASNTAGPATIDASGGGSPMYFGCQYDGLGPTVSGNMNGNISNVMIYTRILTAAEIYQNYNSMRHRYGV